MAEASPARLRTGPVRPRGRPDQGWLAEQEQTRSWSAGVHEPGRRTPPSPLVPSSQDLRRAIFQPLSGSDPLEVVAGHGDALAISALDAWVRYTRAKPGHVQWSRSERRSEAREIRWSLAM